MSMVENSVAMIEEREKEITAIVQSISEINEMYRDLATMVVDQVQCRIDVHAAVCIDLPVRDTLCTE